MATETTGASVNDRSLLVDAVIGAVVSIVLGFLPFSPAIGGAAAGYLHGRDGLKVGAISGLLASIPVMLIFMFVMSLLSIGGMMAGIPGFGMAFVGIMLIFAFMFWLAVAAGLGAIGGVLGEALAKEV